MEFYLFYLNLMELFYIVQKDKTIKVWNNEINILIASLEGHEDQVTCLAFNNHETQLFSCSLGWKNS